MNDSGTFVLDPATDTMRSMRPEGVSLGDLVVEDPTSELSDAVGLSLHDPIGSGASAVVRLGRQRSLLREVAVKQPRQESLRWVLLREARITGRLQHPNILPVYDIVRGQDGDPLILMKRVGGQTWTHGMPDLSLEDNLRILLQVCHAVAFAHSQGVVHRDLKPDNVMVGEFGEVVVLDWGLAVRTPQLDEPWIPLASDQTGIAGTPAFMAPEMLGGVEKARARGVPVRDLPSPGEVGPRTDVFLLGALLYTILEGSPPNGGRDVFEVLCSAWECEHAPPRGDEGLASIAMRAMRRSVDQRYPDAESFRDALDRWLDRCASVGAAELALSRGDLDGATEALAELPHPPRDLMHRLRELRDQKLEEERLRMDRDPRAGMGARRLVLGGMGVLWTVLPVSGHLAGVEHTYARVNLWTLLFLAIASVLLFAYRRQLSRTVANRTIAVGVLGVLVLQLCMDIGSQQLGIDVTRAHVLHLLLWATVQGAAGLVVHRALAMVGVFTLALFGLATQFPEHLYPIMSASNAMLTAVVLVIWCRED